MTNEEAQVLKRGDQVRVHSWSGEIREIVCVPDMYRYGDATQRVYQVQHGLVQIEADPSWAWPIEMVDLIPDPANP